MGCILLKRGDKEMANIFDYKAGDKVVTPTNMVATVIKETYQGEKLILEYDETPEWQMNDTIDIKQLKLKGNGYRHIRSVTLAKEHVRPLNPDSYSVTKIVIR